MGHRYEPEKLETAARVLIVDDHEDNVELLRARLESWGYETSSASDGAEALRTIETTVPDLVLLDIMMPKIDGIDVARRVKNNPDLPFIPIIMQTALDSTDSKVEGLEAGADDYITKPIDLAEPFSCVMVDLDRFKSVNDTYGHQAGDAVLKQLAKILKHEVREIDHAGRYGGEEFV